jgi:hypothetical protein
MRHVGVPGEPSFDSLAKALVYIAPDHRERSQRGILPKEVVETGDGRSRQVVVVKVELLDGRVVSEAFAQFAEADARYLVSRED